MCEAGKGRKGYVWQERAGKDTCGRNGQERIRVAGKGRKGYVRQERAGKDV